jgi:hypothetical protein
MDICFSNPPPNPSDLNYGKQFLTAVMEVPVNTQGSIPVLEPAFSAYLKSAYNYPSGGITCQPIWSIADAQAVQKKISGDASHFKMVDTGWRYGQPPVTQGQSGFDPLAQGPGGLDLTQHRLTTYFCTLVAAGGTTMTAPPGPISGTAYVTPVFQADWDPAPVNMAFNLYMRDHYVHDLNLADKSPHCSAQSPAMQTMQHQGAGVGKLIGHKIPVDWTYTPDQGAAASAAVAAAAPPPAPNPAAGGWYVSCSTSGGAGVDTYYTGVFRTSHAVKHSPNGANLVVEGQTILDHFYAWLMQQGYNFKPGSSSACDAAPTEAAAMAAHHKRAYEGGGCSTCGKIAETGWKDE